MNDNYQHSVESVGSICYQNELELTQDFARNSSSYCKCSKFLKFRQNIKLDYFFRWSSAFICTDCHLCANLSILHKLASKQWTNRMGKTLGFAFATHTSRKLRKSKPPRSAGAPLPSWLSLRPQQSNKFRIRSKAYWRNAECIAAECEWPSFLQWTRTTKSRGERCGTATLRGMFG